MAKNTKTKTKSKKTTKTKKKQRINKQESLDVMIELNKELNISNTVITNKNHKIEELQTEYMNLAKSHQEYSEKLEGIDDKMNKVLGELLILGNKYSSIDDFLNNLDLNNIDLKEITMKDIPLETVEE